MKNEERAEKIVREILRQSKNRNRFIVAIDGRCASGKTTVSEIIKKKTDCTLFHMDDFFLRPEQRTRERLETPGGNVDYERFNTEIMKPLRSGEKLISYKPYSCREGKLKETVSVNAGRIVIVEGAYSCHPQIRNNYDFRIFFSISHEEQMKRIIKRNGEEAAKVFAERWIPMEETYFRAYNIAEEAELVF